MPRCRLFAAVQPGLRCQAAFTRQAARGHAAGRSFQRQAAARQRRFRTQAPPPAEIGRGCRRQLCQRREVFHSGCSASSCACACRHAGRLLPLRRLPPARMFRAALTAPPLPGDMHERFAAVSPAELCALFSPAGVFLIAALAQVLVAP